MSSDLINYTLTTSIGPVTGSTIVLSGYSFGTTEGALVINSGAATGTFQATVVPEPSSLVLAGAAAMAGLGVYLRARRIQVVCRRTIGVRLPREADFATVDT